MKELCINAETYSLSELFTFITGELSEHDCTPRDIRLIRLCVEEIFMNISCYAYAPDTGETSVSIDFPPVKGDSLEVDISFSDRGKPFNPLKNPPPDLDASLEEREIGGLGIHIVLNKMDTVTYDYRDGKNILTMKKELRGHR